MVLGDYKVVLPEVSGLVGMVGQCNLPIQLRTCK